MNITIDKNIGRVTTKLTLTSCSLSIIGGFFIIYTFVKIETLRNSVPRNFLVFITCADLLISTGYIIGTIRYTDVYLSESHTFGFLESDHLCKVQSFMTTYGSISSFIWTDLLAIYLFRVVKYGAKTEVSIPVDTLFHFFGWIVPGVIVGVALSYDVLGEDLSQTSGPWCWLKRVSVTHERSEQIKWTFLAGKAYEIVTYVITVTLYINMKIYIWRKKKKQQGRPSVFDQDLREEDEYFWLTWIILLSLRLAGTIRTCLFIANVGSTDTTAGRALLYVQSYGDGAQAFVNCICYCGFDGDIREFLKNSFQEYRQGFSRLFQRELDDGMNIQFFQEKTDASQELEYVGS